MKCWGLKKAVTVSHTDRTCGEDWWPSNDAWIIMHLKPLLFFFHIALQNTVQLSSQMLAPVSLTLWGQTRWAISTVRINFIWHKQNDFCYTSNLDSYRFKCHVGAQLRATSADLLLHRTNKWAAQDESTDRRKLIKIHFLCRNTLMGKELVAKTWN